MDTNITKFNTIVNMTILNIHTKTKDFPNICLTDFNWKNLEHKYFLEVLMAFQNSNMLCDKAIHINTSFIIRKKIEKIYHVQVYKMKKEEKAISVQEILDFMRPACKKMVGENFSFADIYKEFYEREAK